MDAITKVFAAKKAEVRLDLGPLERYLINPLGQSSLRDVCHRGIPNH
jgi:hypothetical protein